MKNPSRDARARFSARLVGIVALLLCLGPRLATLRPVSVLAAQSQEQQQQPQPPQPEQPQPQQAQPSDSASPARQPATEMDVKDESTTPSVAEAARFRVNVKLVLARVVVRDSSGHAIGGLHKEDFELLDNGKPQVISDFDVEHPTEAAATATAPPANPTNSSQPAVKPPEFPVRYVIYLFDDLHISFQDLAMVRNAAHHRIDALAPTDRAAILSTSGQTVLDFTDDRAQLHATLNKLLPRPISGGDTNACPPMGFYQADLIVNKQDPNALQTGINDYVNCANLPPQAIATAQPVVEATASRVLTTGEHESRIALGVIHDAIRRIMAMPGQRNILLISPGFLTPDLQYEFYDIIDRALRAQVVINAIDARGLYVLIPGGDASTEGHPDVPIPGQQYPATPHTVLDTQEASADDDILSVLSYGTGGNFFHNSNDMEGGLRRLAEAPEYYYILGFTPQNLKTDGKFHTLKVTLTSRPKYDLQARRGYYAPRQATDASEEAKREIEDEVLSSDELHDLPVVLHTQFFKASDNSAKLTVMARVDVKRLHYKQADNRNQNDLTVVTAVFDRNGNFLQANQKVIQMRWKTETLQARLAAGITLRASFDVKPGRYMVRVVARDTEQQLMSAQNGAVEIP